MVGNWGRGGRWEGATGENEGKGMGVLTEMEGKKGASSPEKGRGSFAGKEEESLGERDQGFFFFI